MQEVIRRVSGEGFQVISSNHHLTNNSVIIPKLKAGFIIVGIDTLDLFGTLVRLDYYVNPLRRKVMEVRCGHRRPDESVSALLGL